MPSIHDKRQEKLCALLREARKEAGLTQVELATKLGQYKGFVSNYETGERRLDVVEFLEVTEALGVGPDVIMRAMRESDR
jgi:transcriptional regulator with XRE-family HTH domain